MQRRLHSVTRSGAEQRWKKGPGNVFSKVRLPNSTSASHGTERNRDGRKVQGMYFPKFGCLILHQCNTERSGTEMEERSREHFPMFGCLILHQRNTKRSGTEMEERSRECILQCSVALFYSFPPSLSPFRSVPFRSVFPGNIEIIFYFLSLPVSLPPSVPLRCVPFFQIKNGMEPNEMEWNGKEWIRTNKPSFLPFRSVAFVHNNFFAKTSTLF